MRPRGGCNGARKQVSRATLRGVRVGLCAAELIVEEEKQLEELKKLLASADSTGDVTGADALRSKIDAIKAKEAEVVKEEAELNADIRKLREAEFQSEQKLLAERAKLDQAQMADDGSAGLM